jgi:hypothetical protein
MGNSAEKPLICPSCYEIDSIRTILYGMITSPVDESKYVLGGCVISTCDPRYHCINCDTSIQIDLIIPSKRREK